MGAAGEEDMTAGLGVEGVGSGSSARPIYALDGGSTPVRHSIPAVNTAQWFRRLLLPGFVFQSVVIAGGYGTGRELAEFFLSHGPRAGLMGMVLVSMVIWSAVSMATYEFARVFRAYDYRTFFQHLLGRGWILYEVCYALLLLVILAVIAAASGTILEETFGLPYAVGAMAIMAAVGLLVFRGSVTIERFFALWSFLLYGVFLVFLIWCVASWGDASLSNLSEPSGSRSWIRGGVAYAAYNLGVIPAILFAIRHAESRRDTLVSGALAGPIAMIPGVLFYLAMAGQYPEILDRPVPANMMLDLLGSRGFQIAFQVVLFGTLIETGTGLIHAVNERVAAGFHAQGLEMPALARPLVAVGLLIAGVILSKVGLIALIARGYGTLTWAFLIVFVIPILTLGIWKISRANHYRSDP
jgi:uncharacterized membrane protein YkvI